MENKTPLQELIAYMEDHSMSGTGTYRKAQSLLPSEKQFAEKCFEAGIGFVVSLIAPDFPTYWEQNFETEELPNP